MKINAYILGGVFSGLVIGGLLDILIGSTFFWLIFVIFGIQTGIIFYQRDKFKQKNKK